MARMPRTRVIVSVSAVAGVLALVSAGVVRAGDAPSLPPIAADRLLASSALALSGPVTIAGDVQTHLDVGLPEVPSGLGGEGGAVAMIGGTQRFRVWHSSDGLRVAHVTQVSERDLVVNHHEAWWWNASELKATRVRAADLRRFLVGIPGGSSLASADPAADGRDLAESVAAMEADPITVARRFIERLAPSATLTVDGADEVAGRPVYDLVLTPTSTRTLIGSVEISVDAETRLPLRLAVFARGSDDAAMLAGFTNVSFEPIDASVFAFRPPPGAEIVDALGAVDPLREEDVEGISSGLDRLGTRARVMGEGFETRVAVPVAGSLPTELTPLLPYAGPLLSVLEVDHGEHRWLLIGAVPLDVLQTDAVALP
jgi:hypothetical protein